MQRVQRVAHLTFEGVGMMALPIVMGILLIQIRVMDTLSPFAAAFCAALFQFGNAGLFAAFGCAFGLMFATSGISAITAWVVAGLSLCHVIATIKGYRIQKRLSNILFFTLILAGILNSLLSLYMLLIAAIDGILVIIMRQLFLLALEGFSSMGDKQPLSIAQTLSLAILACAVVMGTSGMTLWSLNLMHILIGSISMVLALCVPAAVCGCFGIMIGFFAALCGGASIQIVSNIGLCALCSGYCGRLGKFGATMGFLLCNALFTLYFHGTALSLHLGEAMIAAAICLAIPQHLIDTLSALVCHHVNPAETARARMVSHSASQHIHAVATAFEKTAKALTQGDEDKPHVRVAQRQLDMAALELNKTARIMEKAETFDAFAERAVLHRLRLSGLEPTGVAVQKMRDSLQVRVDIEGCGGRGLCNTMIKKAISEACEAPMQLQQAPCRSQRKRKCSLKYTKAQRIAIQGGVAAARRKDSRVCGDVVSTRKLGGGRELFCLCDGMGSGELAREAAIMAVDLIESYFEAGYSQDEVLITVNQLLTLRQSEVFAAADLLVIDTEQMQARFIKTCAGPSFMVRDGRVSTIEMGALPMGVLDYVQPAVLERGIRPGDIIVMVSDGISDAMQGENVQEWLMQALGQEDESHAANAILELAQQKMGADHDDMTVIVLHVVPCKSA